MAGGNVEAKWNRPSYNEGQNDAELSFLTNGSSDPVVSSFRGRRCIASITRVSTGKYLVTCTMQVVSVVAPGPDLADDADDGAYASIGSITGEASSSPLSFFLFTRNSGGTKTDFTGRRASAQLVVKTSNVSPA